MKYLSFTLLFIVLLSCTQTEQHPKTESSVASADTVEQEKSITPEPVKLLGTWKVIVTSTMSPREKELQLRFVDNGKYNAKYNAEVNVHGDWLLHGDSLILHTKAVDYFKVLELNDSLLKLRTLSPHRLEYSFHKIAQE